MNKLQQTYLTHTNLVLTYKLTCIKAYKYISSCKTQRFDTDQDLTENED